MIISENIFSKKSALLMSVFIAIITIGFGYFAINKTTYSVDLERYYPRESQQIQFYESYKSAFLDSSERTVVAVLTDQSIFNPKTLKAIDRLTDSIESLQNVRVASSLTNTNYLSYSSFVGMIQFPYVHPDQPELAITDSQYIVNESDLVGSLIALNHNGFSIQVLGKYSLSDEEVIMFKEGLVRVLQNCGFENYYLGGRVIGQKHILETMKKEMVLYTLISVCVVLIVLGFMYRTIWGLLGPLLVIGITSIWILGIMAIMNVPLGLFSSMIPAILFVIGTSDVIHILHKYIDELRIGKRKSQALLVAYKEVGTATFLTTITTIIGFLTLLTSGIVPIREFGVFSAIGVGVAFTLTYSLFPAFLILTPIPRLVNLNDGKRTKSILNKSYLKVQRNKKTILVTYIVIILVGVWTANQLKADNYLTEELPENDPFKTGFNYIEKNYSGLRAFEVAISIKDANKEEYQFTSPQVLSDIDKLNQFVKEKYATNSTVSLATIVRAMLKAKTGKKPKKQVLTEIEIGSLTKEIRTAFSNKAARFLLNKESGMTRITGLVKDAGGYQSNIKNGELMDFATNQCKTIDVTITGMSYLIDQNNKRIVADMVEGLGIAFFLVSLLIAFVYRSLKLVLIALIPNMIPLLMITTVMLLAGINLNVSTALIFAIAFGITVDDTIHFLSKLKLELDKGEDLEKAIETTFVSTGKAIIITSIILFLGFIVLSFSSFSSNYYFGLLVSLTIVFAVFSDLLLLPILLQKSKISPNRRQR